MQLRGYVGAGKSTIIPTRWEAEILKGKWTLKRSKQANGRYKEYVQGRVNGQYYFLHRYIMELEHGLSEMQVDHKDNEGLNNSLENLHYVTRKENLRGRRTKVGKNSEIGLSWEEDRQRWQVHWYDHNRKLIHKRFTVRQYGSKENAEIEAKKFNSDIRNPETGEWKIITLNTE